MSSDLERYQRLLTPFVKRAVATADGAAAGTTIVAPQLPAIGEFGLGEATGQWNDAQVLILTGDMRDQLRRVMTWVQLTGTLTVDHRFNNPNVSLLSANVLAAAVIIPVVDASVFSAGEAYIWDAVNAETVTITVVDTVLNQLTIAAPGLVNPYTVAAGAAISMSPRILATTQLLLMTPTKVEDTGVHTNPRRYEKENGVFSAPITRAGGVATALWTIATVRPRTAGRSTTIYTLIIENNTGAAITGWLEIAAVAITPVYHVEAGDAAVIDFVAGMTTGNFDVNCNASVNGVVFQIVGTEA